MVLFVMTMRIVIMVVRMLVIMTVRFMVMRFVVVMAGIGVMFAFVGVRLAGVCAFLLVEMRFALIGLGRLRGVLAGVLDHIALDAVTMAAAARVAVARAPRWRLEERFSLSSSASRWARSSASISA